MFEIGYLDQPHCVTRERNAAIPCLERRAKMRIVIASEARQYSVTRVWIAALRSQ